MLIKDLEELLKTRQYYLLRITDLQGSVVHNRHTRKQHNYYSSCLKKVETQIKELLDNNELE